MAALPRLQLRLVDNDGGVARPGYYLPDATPLAAALSFANALRDVIRPLSSANLDGAKLIYDLALTPSGPAAPESNSREKLALFYSTGAVFGSILIPSPRQLAYDAGGPWRSFRLTRESAITAGLLDEIEAIATGTVFQTGDPFPNIFIVGALEQIVA